MSSFASPTGIWDAGLVFIRIGALIMLIPGIGETYVLMRARLGLALLLSLCILPIASPSLPAIPASIDGMAADVIKEALVGLMIGGLLRMFVAALTTAGELVSLQTTLSFSQTANPTQAQPTTSVSTFLMLVGTTLVFDTDLHRMFIAAMAHSYTLFPSSRGLPLNDAGTLAIQTVGKTFALGLQLAAPVVVFSLVFNLAAGLIGRAMPQFQIFFVATPLSLLLGLSVFALSLGTIGLVWVRAYGAFAQMFT
jgi:flagellar biosynthetic protein FliR